MVAQDREVIVRPGDDAGDRAAFAEEEVTRPGQLEIVIDDGDPLHQILLTSGRAAARRRFGRVIELDVELVDGVRRAIAVVGDAGSGCGRR